LKGQTNWNTLVAEFGRSIGLPAMSPGEIGLCRVELDDCIAIDFETDASGNLHLYCAMPPLPDGSRQALHASMLQANYIDRQPARACFGIDPANGETVLLRHGRGFSAPSPTSGAKKSVTAAPFPR
jgi:hypothetical protein